MSPSENFFSSTWIARCARVAPWGHHSAHAGSAAADSNLKVGAPVIGAVARPFANGRWLEAEADSHLCSVATEQRTGLICRINPE